MVNLSRKKYVRLLVVALIICLISMIGASLVNTNFGHIKVQNFSIEDANGHKIALVMYKPENATAETPAPCVVTLHGSFDAKETQDYTCLELAKRGFVVLSMDCDGHGDSDNYKDNPMDAFFTVTANPGSAFEDISTSPGSGMCDVVNYAYNSLSFVDKDQIGITGHSLGGKMANACLAYNKIQEANGGVNQVAAVFLMGNQQLNIDGVWQDHLNYDPDDTPDSGDEIPLYYDVDYGIDAGQLDENNYQTEAGGPQNFYKSANARVLINELDNYDLQEGDDVEVGKIYEGTVQGSEEKYIRALYQPYETHILNHYSLATTSNLVDFFQNAFEAPNYIDAGSLTIQYKWFFNTIGVIGFFLSVYAFASILLTTGFFGTLLAKKESDIYVPTAPKPIFELGEDEIEYGMGLHGEKGVERTKWEPADVLVEKMYRQIMEDSDLKRGDKVCVLVNGLGSTTILELSIVFRKLNELLKEDGIGIYDTDLNNYCTSQEMGGFSITLMKLDDELRKYYDMPCYCPFYAKGAVEPVGEVADEIEDTAPKKEKKEKKQRIASTYVRGKHYEKLNAEDCRQMLLYIADKILANEPYLTEVDSAIGDGDHGIGMATGMKNVKEVLLDMEGEKNVYSIFEEAGKAMLLSMGGASGVIFGSLYLEGALGTESKDYLTAEDLKAMEEKSLKAIQERGKASVGDKTMVDALAPAVEAMQQHYTEGLEKMLEEAEAGALRGVENTKDCIARFGRAKSLGERALGFQDAGATSTWLIFQSMREFVKGE